MFRVKNVMVPLVALSLMAAFAVQPATAAVGDLPTTQDEPGQRPGEGTTTFVTCGDPGTSGEGDPDSVGGGYGARLDDSAIFGLFNTVPGGPADAEEIAFQEFMRMLIEKFVPNP